MDSALRASWDSGVGARPFGLAYALVIAVRSGGERRRPYERRSRESHERSESYESAKQTSPGWLKAAYDAS